MAQKWDTLLKEGKFYEYEQKLKTFAIRYKNTGKLEEMVNLLLFGITKLGENKQGDMVLNLSNLLLTSIN